MDQLPIAGAFLVCAVLVAFLRFLFDFMSHERGAHPRRRPRTLRIRHAR